MLLTGSGSQKVHHDLPAIANKIEIILITIGIPFENSTDLSSGRRPELKSVEFSDVNPLVIEKKSRLSGDRSGKVLSLLGASLYV